MGLPFSLASELGFGVFADYWSRVGLKLNPYEKTLRWVHTQGLWRQSPQAAIEYWGKQVEWEFWSHDNHAVMAQLYAQVGDFQNAERELAWTRGSKYYEPTSALLSAEKQKRASPPAP